MKIRTAVLLLFSTSVLFAQTDKPRVFVSESRSSEFRGARPQTEEVIKTFEQRCRGVTMTMNKDRADYVVQFGHEGGKNLARRKNKIVVFRKDGDSLFSESTRNLGHAVIDACNAIGKDGMPAVRSR